MANRSLARALARALVGTLALTVVTPGLTRPATAATVVRLDLPELVSEADLVLLATVESTEAFRAGNRIMTRVTLRPGTVIKGAAEGEVTVVVAGGSIGGIGQRVSGAARFVEGEDVVAFLTAPGPTGRRAVVGMAQGKLRVVPGLDGVRLVRDLDGLNLLALDADGQLAPGGAAPAELPVDRFIAALAQMVDAPARLTPAPQPTAPAPAGDVKP